MTNGRIVPPERDRRRTERIRFEPLRVRVYGNREGILVDLSEGGALVLFPAAPPREKEMTLHIEWRDKTVAVQGRVIRSTPRNVQLEGATLARTEYYVAVEFVGVSPDTAAALRQIING